jgi:alpha-L-fucosidase
MHGQVREICTNYGKLDILWFDFSYGKLTGEAWRATELTNMIRSLQPDAIIDNRLEVSGQGFGSLATANPNVYSGDFVSPEQIIPPEGILDTDGNPVTWEACITMNNNWGYCEFDREFKSADLIIRKLVECVSKNGNMLLNIGPDARGNIPPQSLKILSEVGRWMRLNGESIYGCGKADLPKPDNGRYTARGNTLYAHITEGAIGPIPLQGVRPGSIRRARLLSTGVELHVADNWTVSNYPDTVFIPLGPVSHFTYALPDPIDTVIALELKD